MKDKHNKIRPADAVAIAILRAVRKTIEDRYCYWLSCGRQCFLGEYMAVCLDDTYLELATIPQVNEPLINIDKLFSMSEEMRTKELIAAPDYGELVAKDKHLLLELTDGVCVRRSQLREVYDIIGAPVRIGLCDDRIICYGKRGRALLLTMQAEVS